MEFCKERNRLELVGRSELWSRRRSDCITGHHSKYRQVALSSGHRMVFIYLSASLLKKYIFPTSAFGEFVASPVAMVIMMSRQISAKRRVPGTRTHQSTIGWRKGLSSARLQRLQSMDRYNDGIRQSHHGEFCSHNEISLYPTKRMRQHIYELLPGNLLNPRKSELV